MTQATSVLGPWASFYVMTGSSAAALTGLMFVVISLVTGARRNANSPDGIGTFSTPTVVHFCAVLLLSAVLSAPWPSLAGPLTVLAVAGAVGLVYIAQIMARTRRLTTYQADGEDWAWYAILPLSAYLAIFAGAIMLAGMPAEGMFVVAAGAVLLIFIGIHNAWDIVTYLAISRRDEGDDER